MLTRRCLHVLSMAFYLTVALGAFGLADARAQGLGGAGTVQGTVKDPTGGVMQAVEVSIGNAVSRFTRTTTTDATGRFVFSNLPPNSYHVAVEAQGFMPFGRDVDVRSAVPITFDIALSLAGATSTVEVVGHAEDLTERDPTAHTDIDQSLMSKLPLESSSGLNQVVTLASPGVVSDSNGFFHPIGDHAQTQFSIDNQPVTDQQSRVYSNQISPDAVQSMEIITGVAPAEFGDKSSLVVHIVTKSGLDQPKPAGTVEFGYGSFKSPTGEANLGGGSHALGDFVSISGMQTDRFLDPPEFMAIHDHGHALSLFNRLDAHAGDTSTFHLNLQAARSSFDVPNTVDQNEAGQAQHQAINTLNVAPGFSQVIGATTLFTANGFVRQDHLTYLPSADPLDDQPASVSQDRRLTNIGAKADVSYTTGSHNVKFGGTISATRLDEHFTIGFTDPAFNDPTGEAFDPNLAPYDLTRGGSPLVYAQAATIKQQAAYVQDDIKAGNASFKLGLRLDHYDGLSTATLLQPRLGVSYAVPTSSTVFRGSYGRTLETPYNENLLLSSGLGLNGRFGDGQILQPGKRNQVEVGVQQGIGRWLVADFGYFNKRTDNGYDFGVLFNTPIVFPVSWDHSKIDGFTGRVNLVEHHGLSA
ncbi:MAG: TonB-dependent receptor, partial [Vicinamibacterales bacterium]